MSRAHYLLLLSMCVFAAASKADIVNVSPSSLDFGSQVLTISAVQPVVLSNATKKDLNISGVTITGDFSVSSNSCGAILQAGQSCTIYVVFAPTAAGLRTGLLSINDDANNTPAEGEACTDWSTGAGFPPAER